VQEIKTPLDIIKLIFHYFLPARYFSSVRFSNVFSLLQQREKFSSIRVIKFKVNFSVTRKKFPNGHIMLMR